MQEEIKQVKLYLKYCKKALKMIDKMYKWPYIPLEHPLAEKEHIKHLISFYQKQLKELKTGMR